MIRLLPPSCASDAVSLDSVGVQEVVCVASLTFLWSPRGGGASNGAVVLLSCFPYPPNGSSINSVFFSDL